MNKKLLKYIKIFHAFTFKVGAFHASEFDYEKRLKNHQEQWIPMVQKARRAFLIDYIQDKAFKAAYHEYMDRELDFILYVNCGVSAPDQRKYGGGDEIPFTAYWYQVVLFELYKRFSIAYFKSRDAGFSFAIISGESMQLCHAKASESILMSRIEKEVDISGDRSQTFMGRIRRTIDRHPLYSMKRFKMDKFMRIYRNDRVGTFGSATVPNPGSGNRVERGVVDEAGKVSILKDIRQSLTMAATYMCYGGTLKAGSDTGLRDCIKEAYQINPKEIWDKFMSELGDGLSYREAWDSVAGDLKAILPPGKAITFKNTYRDHPLKSGHCNYREIECNRLFNDPVAIAHELDADLMAPSPDRTLYNATKENIKPADFFEKLLKDTRGLFWVGGFDPGTLHTTAFVPMLGDHEGRLYIMPAVYMTEGDMISFTQKMAMMAPKMTLYPEESVKAYSNVGSGWWTTLQKYSKIMNFKLQISKNRDLEGIALVNNYCLSEKAYNYLTDREEKMILIHEDNEEWLMNYQQGMKRSGDTDQKRWSHAAEAMMAAIYELNRKRDIFKYGGEYGAY